MVRPSSARLLCSHGAALFYIASHRDCTVSDLTDALVVTPRTVWGLVSELRRAGLINTRKEGRRHHFSIKEGAPFPDPVLAHSTLGQFFHTLSPEPPEATLGTPAGKGKDARADHLNADLIRNAYDAFLKRDTATLENLFAEDAVWHAAGTSPLSGDYRGRDAVLSLFRNVGELSGGTFQIDVHTVMADEEHGVALTLSTARRGDKRLSAQSVNVFHVRDGKITEVWQASEDQPAINKFWS